MMTMTSNRRLLHNKVPEVTSYFWVVQVLAATVGGTTTDFMSTKLNFGLTVTSYIMTGMLIVALVYQFRSPRYMSRTYWVAVVMASIVGALITDNLTDNLGVSRQGATLMTGIALVVTLAAWYASQRTLSTQTICTFRREAFYWLTILFAFALGTAAADLLAKRFDLGYWRVFFLFASLVVVVCAARFWLRMNSIACFWAAYVLTTPLGAALGDLLSQRRDRSGLGFGTTTTTSFVFLVAMLTLLAYLAVSKTAVAGRHARPSSRPARCGKYMRYIRRADG